MAPLE